MCFNVGNEWFCIWEVKYLKVLFYEVYVLQVEELLFKVVCVLGWVSIEGYEGEFLSWEVFSKYIYMFWEGWGVFFEMVKLEI